MTQPVRSLLPPLLSALLALGLSGGALASSPQLPAHRSAARMDAVKISITTTGATVWGTVSAKYTSHGRTTQRACSAASCTVRVPQGVTLHLHQTAADSATWPFKDWQVTVHQRTRAKMGSSIALKVTGSSAVTAVYVVAQNLSGGNGWESPCRTSPPSLQRPSFLPARAAHASVCRPRYFPGARDTRAAGRSRKREFHCPVLAARETQRW